MFSPTRPLKLLDGAGTSYRVQGLAPALAVRGDCPASSPLALADPATSRRPVSPSTSKTTTMLSSVCGSRFPRYQTTVLGASTTVPLACSAMCRHCSTAPSRTLWGTDPSRLSAHGNAHEGSP